MQAELNTAVEAGGPTYVRRSLLVLGLAATLGGCFLAAPVHGDSTNGPVLDPTQSALFPDDTAYRGFRAPANSSPAGEVPSLAARGGDSGGWGFQGWGSPDAAPPPSHAGERVTSIAMSSDGREGWAVGPGINGERLTLYRFDGTAWRRCDPASGDPRCADLAELRSRGLLLESIATVDPTSARFEAVAVGYLPGSGNQPATAVILRYRDGSWSVDDAPSDPILGRHYTLRSVAFTGPDDGWAYGISVYDVSDPVMLHFTGGRWNECSGKGTCDDATGVLPERLFYAPVISPALVAVGNRVFLAGTRIFSLLQTKSYYPLILSHRRGGQWEAGLDTAGPGKVPDPTRQAWMSSFAVATTGNGEVAGWARTAPGGGDASNQTLRLAPGGGWETWSPTAPDDALSDHPSGAEVQAALPGETDAETVVATYNGPLVRFDGAEGRWRVLPAPFDPSGANPFTAGAIRMMAPDGHGGLWLVQDGGGKGSFFFDYSDQRHRAVFDDVPQPFAGGRIRQLAAARNGMVWLAGDGAELARYDRVTGWSTLRVPGWSTSAAVTAIAVAPDGDGVAVGEGGRIADITRLGAHLDPASGRNCSGDGGAPCGGDKTLGAVGVADDGSALAGGDGAEVLWRPANGSFRTIPGPPLSADARVTGIALPTATRAWITTTNGEVFAGRQNSGRWSWDRTPEDVGPDGRLLSATDGNGGQALRAIAVDAGGHGYAVGDGGVVLELTGDAWRRLSLGVHDDFTAVALPRGGGDGALIGGALGTIWTRVGGRFEPARPASPVDGYAAAGDTSVSGLALVPGDGPGQTEAWASLDGPTLGGALLHYSSDAGDSLLTPAKPVQSLPDAPAPRPGELSFAAFGKSDCANLAGHPCPGASGTDALSDIVSRRIDEAVSRSARTRGGPRFATFTGDAGDHGGNVGRISHPIVLNEWVDLVARSLDDSGVPMLGAIGELDLAGCTQNAGNVCTGSAQASRTGTNFFWREAMVDRVGQDAGPQSFGGLRYRPVREDSLPSTPNVPLPVQGPDPAPSSVPTGGARTHYAVDVLRGGRQLARLVFVDNSLGSLRASDPLQQPPEPRGQLAWLDQVLSSRPPGLPAVVVSTAPSYSYQPDTAPDAASDGASFEQVVLKDRVSAVVSGRVGWNALYYTLAPGLHCPAPGGGYPEHPPTGAGECGRASGAAAAVENLTTSSHGLGPAVPFVIASSAGGKLAQPSGQGDWHGYSIVRLDASGDPAKTVVEQRPILDWLVITASTHELRPGQRTTLQGVGREPPAADTPPSYHQLTDPSITHRYDLLLADPHAPWMPERNTSGNYVSLSKRFPHCSVGCVDRQSGAVQAGEGTDQPVYAVGVLSAGDLSATYPLVFEPGASRPLVQAHASGRRGLSVGGNDPDPAAPVARGAGPASSGPAGFGPAPSASPFSTGVSPGPFADAPQARPPVPQAPTTPPAPHSASTADGQATPLGAAHVPRVSPVPPSAPPAHPAPQVSLRRRPAQQESPGAAAEDPAVEVGDEDPDLHEPLWVPDLAQAPAMPPGAASTRRDPLPMTAVRTAAQPSAWARDALYGGALTLAALILTTGWLGVRPRRRPGVASVSTAADSRSRPWRDG
jgi:hypothetical protein